MTLNVLFESLNAYILVFCRMGGMIFFNPLLSRKNLPSQFKIALALGMTLLLTPTVGIGLPQDMDSLALLFSMIKELLVGFACGYVFQIFYYMIFTAGDVIDMGFGLSMAKVFDPGANVQMSMSGNLFQLVFMLYIFATNSHLLLIKIMASSYDIVGIGAITFGANVAKFMMTLFESTFSLIMHLALPYMAASFVLEIAMGILMKLIPQINVFSVHFQFKIILGMILLMLFATPTANFLEHYISTMFVSMQNVFKVV